MSPSARCRYLMAAALVAVATAASTSCASNESGGLPTVIIGKAVDTIGFSTVDVAQAMGYFKDAGVNVQTKLLQGSSQTNAALQGGSIQFATLSSTALLLAASHGVKLQAVTSLDYGVSVQVVVNNSWAQSHHIDASQPLKQRMQGLAGAKDAAISSTGESVLALMLNRNGVPPSRSTSSPSVQMPPPRPRWDMTRCRSSWVLRHRRTTWPRTLTAPSWPVPPRSIRCVTWPTTC